MATGALDANGVWIYGEDDPASPVSDLLNLGMDSVSDAVGDAKARLTTLEGIVGDGSLSVATSAIPAAGPFSNTALAQDTTAAWTWTPTRSGIASVRCILDVSVDSAALSFVVRPSIGGVPQQMRTAFPTQRIEVDCACDLVRVHAGVPVALNLDVAVYSNAGGGTIRGGTWRASVA